MTGQLDLADLQAARTGCLYPRSCRMEPQAVLQGYPGSVTATVVYLLTASNELRISMEASATAPTPVNLAQHTYFNLNGQGTQSTILNHDVTINA